MRAKPSRPAAGAPPVEAVRNIVQEALAASQQATAASLAYAARLTEAAAPAVAPRPLATPATKGPDPAQQGLREESERIVARLREVEARIADRYDSVVRAVVARTMALSEQKPPTPPTPGARGPGDDSG
jgi:hypothetical protein